MAGRVFDGESWTDLKDPPPSTGSGTPLPPVVDGDGSIFVGIPSFRDGKRCAKTIHSIFDNASDPDKVTIGLIEQNAPTDDFCVDEYCKTYGVKYAKKRTVRDDVIKLVVEPGRENCPRFDQIKLVAFFNIASSGPNHARSLTRKVLGNEEYCMQIDAHTDFVKGWDDIAKEEWRKTNNEFAIISTVPADTKDRSDFESWTGSKHGNVPRQCVVKRSETQIPEYESPADGLVDDIKEPLLSHAWSSAFSFSKCHLEETVPYDPFVTYVFGGEQFARFARFWTRGYDVYTPTRNIVFHDRESNGHDIKEWFKQRRERLRKQGLARVKLQLDIAPEIPNPEVAHANLGIYGLGKRRTLDQLDAFVGIDVKKGRANRAGMDCGSKSWVAYDTAISPLENLYGKPTDLDPQPEYTYRTEFVYYQETADTTTDALAGIESERQAEPIVTSNTNAPSTMTLLVLWVFGLMVWCFVFVNHGGAGKEATKRRKKAAGNKDV